MTLRVFLVDDHEVVRRGVRQLLEAESDIEVVGEAGTVRDGLAGIIAAEPDVAVLDVRLPDGTGTPVAAGTIDAIVGCLALGDRRRLSTTPVSSGALKLSPNSLRFTFAFADAPMRVLPQGSLVSGETSSTVR